MRMGLKIFAGFIFLSAFMGCAVPQKHQTTWHSQPSVQQFSTDAVDLQLKPLKQDNSYYIFFELTIRNKTMHPIQIDWNETHYIHQGKDKGLFVFRDIDPEQFRKRTIPKETVPAKGSLIKLISPARTITWTKLGKTTPTGSSAFSAGMLPSGANGLSLLLAQQGHRWRQTLTVKIFEQTVGN